MQKLIRTKLFYLVLGVTIAIGITSVFAYTILAPDVGFTPKDNNWEVENTKEALDSLYDLNASFSTIRFITNGGTSGTSLIKVTKGEKLWSLPTATKTDYVFAGWYSDDTYTTKITADNLDTNDDRVLFAKWIYGQQVSKIPSSDYKSLIGQTVNYNGDSNWVILYIGNKFATDGVHMYLISKTSRWSGKPNANGAYAHSVLNKSSGSNLLDWAKQYSSSNGNSNGASKTWSMLTPSNYSSYCKSDICDFAAAGPTIDLYFEAYNLKTGSSINYKQYNSTGYTYNAWTGINNAFNLSNTTFWFSSPGSYGNGWVMILTGNKTWCYADKDGNVSFNPIVSIKSNSIIYHNGTNYSIVAP